MAAIITVGKITATDTTETAILRPKVIAMLSLLSLEVWVSPYLLTDAINVAIIVDRYISQIAYICRCFRIAWPLQTSESPLLRDYLQKGWPRVVIATLACMRRTYSTDLPDTEGACLKSQLPAPKANNMGGLESILYVRSLTPSSTS